MKTYLILIFLSAYYCYSYSQTTPCNDEMVLAKKANWKFGFRVPLENGDVIPKAQQPEIIKRIDAMHQLVLEAYPQGLGMEPWYSRGAGSAPENKDPYSYTYRSGYPFYYCSQSFSSNADAKDEKLKFMESHYNTTLYIYANHLPEALLQGANDTFEINGKQVYPMAALVGKWKGFNVYRHRGDNQYEMVVVVSRDGKSITHSSCHPKRVPRSHDCHVFKNETGFPDPGKSGCPSFAYATAGRRKEKERPGRY
jgi:hypothetical protein